MIAVVVCFETLHSVSQSVSFSLPFLRFLGMAYLLVFWSLRFKPKSGGGESGVVVVKVVCLTRQLMGRWWRVAIPRESCSVTLVFLPGGRAVP